MRSAIVVLVVMCAMLLLISISWKNRLSSLRKRIVAYLGTLPEGEETSMLELAETTGASSLGALYAACELLESEGVIQSRYGIGGAERGGRPKKFIWLCR